MFLFIVGILLSYLLGSVPFGLLIGFAKHIDVRKLGSKNIGATNVARALGSFKWFVLVFILDFIKGLLPALLFSYLAIQLGETNSDFFFAKNPVYISTIYGLAAILGHMFPVYLIFKGGKGVATGAGVVVALTPVSFAIAFAVFLLVFFCSKYVSLGSIMASIGLVAAHIIFSGTEAFGKELPITCFLILICLLIIIKHRTNIKRIFNAEEEKISIKRKKQKSESNE